MAKSIHRVSVTLTDVRPLASDIKLFRLADPDGWNLPPFEPGAHIDLHLPSGAIRQYSLCGDAADRTCYEVAIKQESAGRGGSKEAHELETGAELLVSLPRNLFPLVPDHDVVIIAGGIGITPFIPMLAELDRTERAYTLHYASRHTDVPFAQTLKANKPDNVTIYPHETSSRLNIDQIIDGLPANTHLYCCGPSRLIDAVIAETQHMNERVHIEYFGGMIDLAQKSYDVHLARTGRTIGVQEGQTMLEALRAAEIAVPASCEGGICLDCKTRYIAGEPEHRDITLPKSERDQFLTPCVSGCVGKDITLDL
ncbi:PDR/VanB family oxidoreductase [Tateyamaria sp.]|uniref:PDR/VanB family oxidoreductase n=1 Tax=Tateyamaria sp. TaxID=1929288 RepID=UPI00329F262A